MDVTNPGLVSVEAEVYANPDPNGGTARWRPRELDVLEAAADDASPMPPGGGAEASVGPTPAEVVVTGLVPLVPVGYTLRPPATEVNVDDQQIGQGQMVPVDPLQPALGSVFVGPAEFTVVEGATSVQTNASEEVERLCVVTAVLDADNLPAPAGPATVRYYLVVALPSLTAYPVSLLGRQIVFADDALTVADQGAARFITGYGGNFVVINRDDVSPDNGDVPQLATPQAGDTFFVDVERRGSEDVSTTGAPEVDVFVLPDPPPFVGGVAPQDLSQGTVDVSTLVPPGTTLVGSGVRVPRAVDVAVADQSPVVGLPQDFYS